jgi:high-affinity K+ transport system ATPase subunit B
LPFSIPAFAQIVRGVIIDAFRKLDRRPQIRNPVMLVVFAGSIVTTVIGVGSVSATAQRKAHPGSSWHWRCGCG